MLKVKGDTLKNSYTQYSEIEYLREYRLAMNRLIADMKFPRTAEKGAKHTNISRVIKQTRIKIITNIHDRKLREPETR